MEVSRHAVNHDEARQLAARVILLQAVEPTVGDGHEQNRRRSGSGSASESGDRQAGEVTAGGTIGSAVPTFWCKRKKEGPLSRNTRAVCS